MSRSLIARLKRLLALVTAATFLVVGVAAPVGDAWTFHRNRTGADQTHAGPLAAQAPAHDAAGCLILLADASHHGLPEAAVAPAVITGGTLLLTRSIPLLRNTPHGTLPPARAPPLG